MYKQLQLFVCTISCTPRLERCSEDNIVHTCTRNNLQFTTHLTLMHMYIADTQLHIRIRKCTWLLLCLLDQLLQPSLDSLCFIFVLTLSTLQGTVNMYCTDWSCYMYFLHAQKHLTLISRKLTSVDPVQCAVHHNLVHTLSLKILTLQNAL